MPGDKEKILEAGCHDYISKPFRLHEFLEKIKEYLPEDSV
jgi:DNA-binding response OmpR family regulator